MYNISVNPGGEPAACLRVRTPRIRQVEVGVEALTGAGVLERTEARVRPHGAMGQVALQRVVAHEVMSTAEVLRGIGMGDIAADRAALGVGVDLQTPCLRHRLPDPHHLRKGRRRRRLSCHHLRSAQFHHHHPQARHHQLHDHARVSAAMFGIHETIVGVDEVAAQFVDRALPETAITEEVHHPVAAARPDKGLHLVDAVHFPTGAIRHLADEGVHHRGCVEITNGPRIVEMLTAPRIGGSIAMVTGGPVITRMKLNVWTVADVTSETMIGGVMTGVVAVAVMQGEELRIAVRSMRAVMVIAEWTLAGRAKTGMRIAIAVIP